MSLKNVNQRTSPSSSCLQDNLSNAILLTEAGVDLRRCYVSGRKCISQLRNIINTTENAVNALQSTAKRVLEQANKMVVEINNGRGTKEGQELMSVIDKHLTGLSWSSEIDVQQMTEKMRHFDKKFYENTVPSWTNKNVRSDINEKYPESLSRESLIDLTTIVNLPPVPEDIPTGFFKKPTRSSSLSSLKSMRKVKLFLQKAENSDDDDSSDIDDQDYVRSSTGDVRTKDSLEDDIKQLPVASKKLLGNITEETKVED
ncbi:uncharacterized protein [Diabrotica undecimpunctata]|uniref:uncharacterized protein n=1 Tax=Diabrotica undecimpunctata TaxID=50387 RepID=UPI003B642511